MAGLCKLISVTGNPRAGSRTLTVAIEAARQIEERLRERGNTVQMSHIDLAELSSELFAASSARVDAALHDISGADLLVVASPTYKATYTGLLKVFFDRLPSNALHDQIAVPVMVAAAPGHALAVETYLRPLLVELGASCPTRGLFVLEGQLADLPAVVESWLATSATALDRMGWGETPAPRIVPSQIAHEGGA